jgi:hypothetical protein
MLHSPSYQLTTDLNAPKFSTPCYALDIANSVLGWAGSDSVGSDSPCTLPNPQK